MRVPRAIRDSGTLTPSLAAQTSVNTTVVAATKAKAAPKKAAAADDESRSAAWCVPHCTTAGRSSGVQPARRAAWRPASLAGAVAV